jgi:hypothetical protein
MKDLDESGFGLYHFNITILARLTEENREEPQLG